MWCALNWQTHTHTRATGNGDVCGEIDSYQKIRIRVYIQSIPKRTHAQTTHSAPCVCVCVFARVSCTHDGVVLIKYCVSGCRRWCCSRWDGVGNGFGGRMCVGDRPAIRRRREKFDPSNICSLQSINALNLICECVCVCVRACVRERVCVCCLRMANKQTHTQTEHNPTKAHTQCVHMFNIALDYEVLKSRLTRVRLTFGVMHSKTRNDTHTHTRTIRLRCRSGCCS